jgi:protein gp37
MSSINTGIEWTDRTWNPATGCNKVSPGCTHCYAEAITKRFTQNFPQGFDLTLHPERLQEPMRWRTPSRIFVNSMSDLFHEEVPISFLRDVFEVIRQTPHHIYQVLTKRHERLPQLVNELEWHENIWLGVSVENQKYVQRVDYLRQVPAKVRFLSCEPLLGALELNLTDIHWVIVGGESGIKHRPMQVEWAQSIRDQCQEAGVAFFFKQWGGRTPKIGGRLLDEQIWDEMPAAWEQHCQQWTERKVAAFRKSNQVALLTSCTTANNPTVVKTTVS